MAENVSVGKLGTAYANYLKVGQNAFEFLLDFGQLYIEEDDAQFHTRIITTPVYAKAFFKVLKDCIDRYEQNFGMIPDELVSNGPMEKWWLK